MVAVLASNFFLIGESCFYTGLLAIQIGLYVTAIGVSTLRKTPKHLLLKIPSYFLTVNLAIALAWWRYLVGERVVMWEPSAR
jgi:hypothetical protein